MYSCVGLKTLTIAIVIIQVYFLLCMVTIVFHIFVFLYVNFSACI